MAIYRGPGGSGDATQDAASEVLLAVQAKNDALAAQAAAEAAQAAAELAETNAETAETNAETAETNAETAATNAANSASAASTSASNAATSATNAANSATAAQTAETNAETAETNAAASASAASTSASNAATSATNAANSASSASTSATNASNSASAAATSATNAAASATSASNSASTATTQATNAANSATAAATSASNAASSATSASNSASTATTQATNASNSASAAATSATNAANSASAAATSATNAASSATSAASSATSAAASLDSFDDRYLGAKSSAPTLDNDGNALLNGALYFDSTLAAMRVYNTATATWATIQQGVTDTDPVRHSVRPSLLLDFANTKTLDPRITFTRASTATFYDGKTVAKAEENLLTRSAEFDNAAWSAFRVTVTANSTVAPDGTTTAELITEDTTTNTRGVTLASSTPNFSAGTYTASFFVKAGTGRYCSVAVATNDGASYFVSTFDLTGVSVTQTGAAGSGWSHTTSSITSVGSGWYRLVVTGVANAAFNRVEFTTANSGTPTYANYGRQSFLATGLTYELWGAQLEQRSSVTAYTPTTTQAITNYIPALQTAASGVARFEHNPVTGESLGLEIEEQRTNLLLRSEEFQTTWVNERTTETVNTIIAPDGTLTGDKLVEDNTASNTHTIYQGVSGLTDNTVYTFTVYLKAAERTRAVVSIMTKGAIQRGMLFDLSAGTVSSYNSDAITDPTSSSIQSVGNGWYRCRISQDVLTGGFNPRGTIFLTNGTTVSYTGDSYSGVYLWGAQLEAGAFPTSYIKTEGSQVTRSADSASMTGTNFSSWYSQSQGSLYVDANTSSTTNARYVQIWAGSTGQGGYLSLASDGDQAWLETFNGVVANAFDSKATVGQYQGKLASGFGSTGNTFAFNGNVIGSTTNYLANPRDATSLFIGQSGSNSQLLNGTIRKIAYYPRRLTNAELQSLTTV